MQYAIVLDRRRMLTSDGLVEALRDDSRQVRDTVHALACKLEGKSVVIGGYANLATRTNIQYNQGARTAQIWDEGDTTRREVPLPPKSGWYTQVSGGWGGSLSTVIPCTHNTVGVVYVFRDELGYTGPITHGDDIRGGWRGIHLARRKQTCIFGVAAVEETNPGALRELAKHLRSVAEELGKHSSTRLGSEKEERLITFFIERAVHLEWLAGRAEETTSTGTPK
jgi:hypothetical protein